MTDQMETLAQLIADSKQIVFFGGAGVSTESGIPDFRSVDGLYQEKYSFPPEVMVSHSFFKQRPQEFYQFYRAKMLPLEAKPNPAHRALAHLESEGKLRAIITQNIDGLHQKAGSREVLELHGSVHRNYCLQCKAPYAPEHIRDAEGLPTCSHCGGLVRPDVVLYEEGLDQSVVERAVAHLRAADLLIIGGTSLVVYPAAGLIQYYGGQHIVLLNRDEVSVEGRATLHISNKIGTVFQMLYPNI